MAKIYTKQGDKGSTTLIGGEPVTKASPRIAAYGTLDELNAVLGVVLAHANLSPKIEDSLGRIQSELFQLGAELATPPGKTTPSPLVSGDHVQAIEKEIDLLETELAPLTHFILPGGSLIAANLHLARTVCRRAERKLVQLHHQEPQRLETIQFLNRLADYLFVCARYANVKEGVKETLWISR